jgi:hypothetical protein
MPRTLAKSVAVTLLGRTMRGMPLWCWNSTSSHGAGRHLALRCDVLPFARALRQWAARAYALLAARWHEYQALACPARRRHSGVARPGGAAYLHSVSAMGRFIRQGGEHDACGRVHLGVRSCGCGMEVLAQCTCW